MLLRPSGRELRILDFDIETRRIGFHTGFRGKPDGSEPTAIAASFVGSDKVSAWLVGENDHELVDILTEFRWLYDQADAVTGHYIRKFDLPILNGAMLEHGLPPLDQKLAQDTKVDLVNFEGLSKSQENLAGMLGAYEEKYKMADFRWREATRLRPEGIAQTRKRVVQDVVQHKELRRALLEAGALKRPTLWRP